MAPGDARTRARTSGPRSARRRCALARAAFGAAGLLALVPARAGAAGALETVAQQGAQSLGPMPRPSVVVVAAPLVTDEPAPKADELALRLAGLVAARLGPGSRAFGRLSSLPAARAIAGRASALVYVQAEIAKGDVRASFDVYPTPGNAWDRIRNPLDAALGHAFASAKLDPEVRSFLLPLVLEQAAVHRARHDEQEVLAAACGDVDGDGGDDLVLVSRERVALGRVRGGRFVVERAAPWSDLSPRAPVPLREPLAGAVAALGTIAVGSTDRGSLTLTPDFAARLPIYGVPASGGGEGIVCLLAEPSAGAFDGAPVDCAAARDAKPKLAVPAPRFDAFAAGSVADAQGVLRSVVAVREPSGKLKLKMGDGAPLAPDGDFGAQLAVGDLDQDGVPDIAASADGADDAVDVWSWPPEGGELRPRLHLPAPAGVRALTVCPPEEGGEPVLVAIVGNEIWMVRAGVREPPSAASAAAAAPAAPPTPRGGP